MEIAPLPCLSFGLLGAPMWIFLIFTLLFCIAATLIMSANVVHSTVIQSYGQLPLFEIGFFNQSLLPFYGVSKHFKLKFPELKFVEALAKLSF